MRFLTWPSFLAVRDPSTLFPTLLPWLLALLGFIIVGGVVLLLIRRAVQSSNQKSSSTNFTLQELRDLHAAGELTDEQFDRAKRMLVGTVSGKPRSESGKPPPGNSPPPAR